MVNKQDKDDDDPWIHRVNLSVMFQLLQLDPMAYLVCNLIRHYPLRRLTTKNSHS